jgi:hypothetical protein
MASFLVACALAAIGRPSDDRADGRLGGDPVVTADVRDPCMCDF